MNWRFLIFFILVTGAAIGIELGDLNFAVTEIAWWLVAFLVIAYVLFIEGRDLHSIGLKAVSFETFWVAGLGLVLATILVGISVSLAQFGGLEFSDSQSALAETATVSPWLLALFLLRAAGVEELLFRGFLISRGIEMKIRPMLMVLISTAVFVAPHAIFWPGPHLLLVTSAGLVFGLIFIWKKDLSACILAHIGFNMIGIAMAALQ